MKTSREKVDGLNNTVDSIVKFAQEVKVTMNGVETTIDIFRGVASEMLYRYFESQRIAREQKILRQKQFWLGLTYSESQRLL